MLITVCVSMVLIAMMCVIPPSASATKAEFDMMKRLERRENRSDAPDEVMKRPTFQYTAGSLRDPFQTLIVRDEEAGKIQVSGEVEIPPPKMTVQGVIWGGKFPQAIVNDQLVKVGDELTEGVEITRIDSLGIAFKFHDREYEAAAPAVRDFSKSQEQD